MRYARRPLRRPDGPVTATEALELHGITWQQIEKIAGKALHDAMRARNITLDEDRRTRAHEYFVDLALDWAIRYDAELARGVSFATSCYRRLYGKVAGAKLVDFLRREHGDERRGRPLNVVAAGDRDDYSNAAGIDQESFEQLIENVAPALSPRARDTLRTVAYDVVVLGYERWRIAERHNLPVSEVSELLEELGWQLRGGLESAA